MPDRDEVLQQWSCRGCLGETWIRGEFVPAFCAHCGAKLIWDGGLVATED
jgi:hypothetical protein